MTLYKLTDADGWTRRAHKNALYWSPGVSHTATGEGAELCTDGVINAYEDPLIAVFMNPIHGNISNPRLWECEGEIVGTDNGLKVGVKTLTCVRERDLPKVSTTQRVVFGILAAKAVCEDKAFVDWADKWLSGEDRTAAVARAAEVEAWAAAEAAEAEAAWDEQAAAMAAAEAARAARMAGTARMAAVRAARAAAAAAEEAATDLNFASIAMWAAEAT